MRKSGRDTERVNGGCWRRANGAGQPRDSPLVDGLLVLLVGLDEPAADAHEAAVDQAALQQVVHGLEEQRAALVRQAVLPHALVLGCGGGGGGRDTGLTSCELAGCLFVVFPVLFLPELFRYAHVMT